MALEGVYASAAVICTPCGASALLPDRFTMRIFVMPMPSRARAVARPTGPVPKITCRSLVVGVITGLLEQVCSRKKAR
jgi:hypothetical protein